MEQSELLQLYAKLTESQKNRIQLLLKDFVLLNDQNAETKPEICPVCNQKYRMIKKGKHTNGKQRYLCKGCGHKFTWDSHTVVSNLKIGKDEFYTICLDTLNGVPIKVTASNLNRSSVCVFENRHKFLVVLEEILDKSKDIVSGTVEFDETYLLESVKGTSPKNRKARHRGEPSNLRGISHEQVCIVTTTDRNCHEIFKGVGYAKPTSEIIAQTFSERIVNKSSIYTDGTRIYDKLAQDTYCKIAYLPTHECYTKVEHLNTVNSIHSMIKDRIRLYRGIATKYVNRYTALFVFMRKFLDMDDNEKTEITSRALKHFNCSVTRHSLRMSHLFLDYASIAANRPQLV